MFAQTEQFAKLRYERYKKLRMRLGKGEIADLSAAAGIPASKKVLLRNPSFLFAVHLLNASVRRRPSYKKRRHLMCRLFACGEGEIRTRGRITPTSV